MKVGKGQTVEAYFNQKIRAEETGYHLQRDNERLGRNPPKGPEIPQPRTTAAASEEEVPSREEDRCEEMREHACLSCSACLRLCSADVCRWGISTQAVRQRVCALRFLA